MKRSQYEFAEVAVGQQCDNPGIRGYLSVYILNPVEDPSAREVEDHLLDCRHCREFLLTTLSVRDEARRAKNRRRNEARRGPSAAQVIRLDDHKKERR